MEPVEGKRGGQEQQPERQEVVGLPQQQRQGPEQEVSWPGGEGCLASVSGNIDCVFRLSCIYFVVFLFLESDDCTAEQRAGVER